MFSQAQFQAQAKKVMDQIDKEIGSLRTGGASPQLLDGVVVEAYGSQMKITELASITVSDPTLLVVSPWDTSVLGAIEKSIQVAELNLNPVVDGKIIRISVPPLTQESRQNLVKVLHQKIEAGKVAVRALRGDWRKEIEAQKGQPGISEDTIKVDLDNLEKEIKKLIEQAETWEKNKEAQLLKV